jgi:hypothetical protein
LATEGFGNHVSTVHRTTRWRNGEARGQSYEGTEVEYKGRKFIAFNAEDALGMVIPVGETKKELDGDAQSAPMYVFFKTSARVYDLETKQTYPFRYVKPDDWR